ncbi:hypothetical protein [Xenorhabdus lircayensis]|uniref:Uncharacterized protein n=1 Tax=Xenorhabdus lircayensis TaxID=2763499 RepID=A0ABS0U1L0_9GAMM|nr:hypothetical protein [Xenorhabdus lircayensis]MBI6547771.1 hypothetical protein [Xenorhabdus lircayensis]
MILLAFYRDLAVIGYYQFIVFITSGKIVIVIVAQPSLMFQIPAFIPKFPIPERVLEGAVFGCDAGNANLYAG